MKNINKIIYILTLFFISVVNVNANTIHESIDDYADYDQFIIGNTRFDGNETITANKVIAAAQNQTKLDVALGMPIEEALNKEVTVYLYSSISQEWYVQEDSFVPVTDPEEIKEIEENLDIFFVNNEEKVIEYEYDGNVTNVTNGVKYEDGKFKVPATTFTFEFKEDGEDHVVYTEPEKNTDDTLDFGSFDVVPKADVVATVGTIQFDNLQDALNVSTTENPVKLLKDLTVTEILELKGKGTYNVLDLNGHTLTSSAAEVIMINGTNNTLKITNGNIVSSNGATLYVGTKEQNQTYNKLIVDKNVKIIAEKYGIYVVGDNSELDFNGELVMTTESSAAILGSGNLPCANTIIKIGKDAKINATKKGSFAFYLPQTGTVTINGGLIEADTVIGIKSGELTINEGTLKATGEKKLPEGNNNGIKATGDVIIIEENEGYADNIEIIITEDAILESQNGYYIQEHLYSGTNRAKVYGKYALETKINTGFYYIETSKAQAKIGETLYISLQEALNHATQGETVTVLNDIKYENCNESPLKYQAESENISAILDLNGKTVSATLNNGKSISLIKVGNVNPDRKTGTATLTINDSSEDKSGTLTVKPTVESDGWDVSVSTISVERLGRLIVNNGNIITEYSELVTGGNPYAIDVLTNTGAQTAELTINGGYIESRSLSGMGIRFFANSSKAAVKFVMNGGEVVGASNGRGIWFQQSGGSTYHLIDATLNGGKVTADRALEIGDFNLDKVETENIKITINGGEFISTNTGENPKHPTCDDLYTGKNTAYYNQTFNHVKLVDNRAQ